MSPADHVLSVQVHCALLSLTAASSSFLPDAKAAGASNQANRCVVAVFAGHIARLAVYRHSRHTAGVPQTDSGERGDGAVLGACSPQQQAIGSARAASNMQSPSVHPQLLHVMRVHA